MEVPEKDAPPPLFPGTVSSAGVNSIPIEFCAPPPPRPVPPPYTVFCLVERVWFLLGSQQGWPSAQTFLFMELRLCVPGSEASCGPWRFPVLLTMMVPSPQIRLQMSLGWPESPRGPVGQSTVGLFHGAPFFSAGDPPNQSCQGYWSAGLGHQLGCWCLAEQIGMTACPRFSQRLTRSRGTCQLL